MRRRWQRGGDGVSVCRLGLGGDKVYPPPPTHTAPHNETSYNFSSLELASQVNL